jgi:hypothetical protein
MSRRLALTKLKRALQYLYLEGAHEDAIRILTRCYLEVLHGR